MGGIENEVLTGFVTLFVKVFGVLWLALIALLIGLHYLCGRIDAVPVPSL